MADPSGDETATSDTSFSVEGKAAPLALRAYELGDEHRHIAHPAADIEHPHSGHNASIPKETLRCGRQYPRLPNRPILLAIRMAKDVV
jgi:hypothetical protein